MSRKTRTKSKTRNNAKSRAKKATVSTVKSTDTEETVIPTAEPAIIKEEVAQPEPKEEIKIETPVEENQVIEQPDLGPRRSVVFIGSECYPFVKTGGLGDVMSALPKSLAKLNVDVKVILPRYKCIPWEYQEKMEYKGSFYMDLCSDGRQYYVGIIYHVCNNVNKKVKTCQYIPLLECKKDRVKNPILIFYNFISYITEDVFSVQRHPVHLNMPVQHQILFCILSVLPGSCDMQLSHMQRLRKM